MQISIIFIGFLLLSITFTTILKGKLELKYGMLWISSGALFIFIAIVPGITKFIAELLGIHEPANAAFLLLILFGLFINLSLTIVLSKQVVKLKNIAQAIALMEKRNRDK